MSTDETNTHEFDHKLCDELVKRFPVNSMVDIGCGRGDYVKAFMKSYPHMKCAGYDGNPMTPDISDGVCFVKDFSSPASIGPFELTLCLEVGEHIPIEYEQVFINNVCNATSKHLVISWAHEEQGGTGHVNERSEDWVREEILRRGFFFLPLISAQLREVSILPWFKRNILVFEVDPYHYEN